MSLFRAGALLVAGLLAQIIHPLPAAAQAAAKPAVAQATPPHLRELADKYLPYANENLAHAVEERMTLPPGYSPSLEKYVLVRLEVSETGQVENARIVASSADASAVVNNAILAAVRQLPVLAPGRVAGQSTRANLTLQVRPGVAANVANQAAEAQQAALADSTEARTLRAGTIRRQPGETLGQLLHRTLPASCSDTTTHLLRYAWRPNPAGPQLFFDSRGRGQQEQYEAVLFVLNPLGAGDYDVQALDLGSMGDLTDVISVFFADANHDGQRDLLALTRCDLREDFIVNGERMTGRAAHYQTTALYYRGLDSAGHPRYEQQYREDLDEIATAAEVREALAAPPRRGKNAPPRNPRAKAAN